MIKLALVDPDPKFAEEMERLLEDRSDMAISAVALDLNRALIIAREQKPPVMVFGPGVGADASVSFVKKLTAEFPIGCIILAFAATNTLKMTAKKANVVEVIQIPANPEKLILSVQMAASYAQQLAKKEEVADSEHKCAVVTVFSTKGGVGKTFLATNIATSITQMIEGRVVLVDLDLQFGDVGIMMGLNPDITILEFLDNTVDLSVKRIDELLATHQSGLKVLLAPKDPESADSITGQGVTSVISALREYADFIIVDTPASFNDNVLAVLDESDEICIVLTMDLPSVKNIKLCLRTLNELKYARERQKIVINRVETNIGLKVSEIERALGMGAIAQIQSDKAVSLSINKGVPIVIDAPKLAISKEINDLALHYVSKYHPDAVEVDFAVAG